MKKYMLILITCMFLSSCDDAGYNHYSVSNDATKAVSYKFDGDTYTLSPSESKSYEVSASKMGFMGVENVIAVTGNKHSVKTTRSGNDYSFIDNTPYNLHVINTLPITIAIQANDYISASGATTLSINSNTENNSAQIYTRSPKFTANTNYPVLFDWNFSVDTVYVIIR